MLYIEIALSMSYLDSKIMAEKTALEFAEWHGLEVVTLVLPLVVVPFICPNMPPKILRVRWDLAYHQQTIEF